MPGQFRAAQGSLRAMATDANLRGVYIPIITPFAEDGSVAIEALERLCHEYLDAGAAGSVALGTTREATPRGPRAKDAGIAAGAREGAHRSAQPVAGAGTDDTRRPRQAGAELLGTA